MRVTLDFRLPDFTPVDVSMLLPAQVLRLSPGEIERIQLSIDRRPTLLGEVCAVSCVSAGDDALVFAGSTRWLKHAGRSLDGGLLVVDGDAGYGAGAEMAGGELVIHGSAGDCLGAAMSGGLVRLLGRAGDWCGASLPGQDRGMTGGTIMVGGSTGDFTGMAMRRGLVWVSGSAGEFCGERMLAGTILCAGEAGPCAGRGMKRGSIAAGRMGLPLPGFRPAGRADAEWMRICVLALKGLGVAIPSLWLEARPRRFTGDHLEMGRGEILAYDLVE